MKRKRFISLHLILSRLFFRLPMIIGIWAAFAPLIVSAAQVSLQWDANDPAPDGYRLYRRAGGAAYDYSAPVWTGTTTACVSDGLNSGVTYYFVVRAFKGGEESGNSNEVNYMPAILPDPDADSDGDGMPDNWEAAYGLNPSINDAFVDLDGDGISNIDEYKAGSDPTHSIGSALPHQPLLSQPANGAQAISLTPVLTTQAFVNGDSDLHARTCYQISTTSDFSALVFDRTYTRHLTSLKIPELLLEPETTYYWRVRFYDQGNDASEWSAPFRFDTLSHAAAGDADGNGIIDVQEIDTSTDLDSDGTADVLQAGLQAVVTGDGFNPKIAVKRIGTDVQVVAIHALDVAELPSATNRPARLTGVISFKLLLLNNTDRASVTVYFSQAAPSDAKWYKFDPDEGWIEFTGAVFSADRQSITLVLEDGGAGDDDGVRNGIIVDPSGLGYSQSSDGSAATAPDAGASGCFIDSARHYAKNGNAAVLLMSLTLALLLARFNRHARARKR